MIPYRRRALQSAVSSPLWGDQGRASSCARRPDTGYLEAVTCPISISSSPAPSSSPTASSRTAIVAVRDGKVVHVGRRRGAPGPERHELGNALILPGAIDAQIHSLSARSDQEDFIWSTRSAAAGGVTTIVDMPYDEGNLVCSAEAVRSKVADAETAGPGRFRALWHDRPGRRRQPASPSRPRPEWPPSSSRPSAPIRCASRASRPRLLDECFAAGRQDRPDRRRPQRGRRAGCARPWPAVEAAGITDWRAHGLSRPPLTELAGAVSRSTRPAPPTGCPAHVVHCSLGRGYDIARRYRDAGLCRHHRVLHPLPDAGRGTRRRAARRQGQDQPADPPARRGREALGACRARATSRMVSTDHVELVGRPQDRTPRC